MKRKIFTSDESRSRLDLGFKPCARWLRSNYRWNDDFVGFVNSCGFASYGYADISFCVLPVCTVWWTSWTRRSSISQTNRELGVILSPTLAIGGFAPLVPTSAMLPALSTTMAVSIVSMASATMVFYPFVWSEKSIDQTRILTLMILWFFSRFLI